MFTPVYAGRSHGVCREPAFITACGYDRQPNYQPLCSRPAVGQEAVCLWCPHYCHQYRECHHQTQGELIAMPIRDGNDAQFYP